MSKKDEKIIILTVEEAKQAIGDYIDLVADIVRRYKIPELNVKHPKSIILLMERIEQAEKCDEAK